MKLYILDSFRLNTFWYTTKKKCPDSVHMKENKMSWQRKTSGKRLDSAKRIQICAMWSFFKMALEIRNFKIQFKTYILAILQIFIVIQLLLKKFVWCVTLVRQFFVRIVHLDVLVSVCLYPWQTSKRMNRSGPNFCVGLHISPGKVFIW